MGASFFSDPRFRKKAVIDDLLNPRRWAEHFELLGHRVVGNNLWRAFEMTREDGAKYRLIVLDILLPGGKDSGWGSKGIIENQGPHELDCPLALLDMMGEPNEDSVREWREKVRAFHAARKVQEGNKAAIVPFKTELTLYGARYRVMEPRRSLSGRAAGFRMIHIESGKAYRITPKQLNEATIHVDIPVPAASESAAATRSINDQMALPGFSMPPA